MMRMNGKVFSAKSYNSPQLLNTIKQLFKMNYLQHYSNEGSCLDLVKYGLRLWEVESVDVVSVEDVHH